MLCIGVCRYLAICGSLSIIWVSIDIYGFLWVYGIVGGVCLDSVGIHWSL